MLAIRSAQAEGIQILHQQRLEHGETRAVFQRKSLLANTFSEGRCFARREKMLLALKGPECSVHISFLSESNDYKGLPHDERILRLNSGSLAAYDLARNLFSGLARLPKPLPLGVKRQERGSKDCVVVLRVNFTVGGGRRSYTFY